MLEDQEAELRNPFPSPPSSYQQYTSHNLRLFELYKLRLEENTFTEGSGGILRDERNEKDGERQTDQRIILADQEDVSEWPLAQLDKPRVDWILEDGYYKVFGDIWNVKERIPSLGELGGQQLYSEDPSEDRRPALQSILHSMLVAFSQLIKALLLPPPGPFSAALPEWLKHAEWLTILAQNIMSAVNDLRPVQARYNLEAMMRRQLELRKSETESIHRKCDELQQRLAALKTAASALGSKKYPEPKQTERPVITMQDVHRWAEET